MKSEIPKLPNNLSEVRVLTEEIENDKKSQLKLLNIKDNLTTLESYKSIWMLLEVNPEVVIYFDKLKQERTSRTSSNKVTAATTPEVFARVEDGDEESLT